MSVWQNLHTPCSFTVFLLCFCFPDWLPEAVSSSDLTDVVRKSAGNLTGKCAPNVCKMQELSAKTNYQYPFHSVMMSEEYDHTIWGKKQKNNIFEIIFTTENSVSLYNGQVLVYILRVILNYFTRWPWKQMGWWIVGGKSADTTATVHRLQQWSITDVQHWQCTGAQTIRW